jgi:hypothetical protein
VKNEVQPNIGISNSGVVLLVALKEVLPAKGKREPKNKKDFSIS